MKTPLEQVGEFHDAFGLPRRSVPKLIKGKELKLRKNLITEEHDEVIEAMHEDNLPHIAKELADLIYVVYGAALHYGIDLDRAVELVHESNMSKLWLCNGCKGSGCFICEGVGGHVKYRASDGKVLKSPTYKPPDLSPLCIKLCESSGCVADLSEYHPSKKFCDNCVKKRRKEKDRRIQKDRRGTKEYKLKYRDYSLKKNYGISLEEVNLMLQDQGGCAICKSKNSGKNDWHVDHCHNTDIVRGILCNRCNLMLGLSKDNIDTLKSAIGYLNASKSSLEDK